MNHSVLELLAAVLIQWVPVDSVSGKSFTWGDENSGWYVLETLSPKSGEARWDFSVFEGEVRVKKGLSFFAKKLTSGSWAWVAWQETPGGVRKKFQKPITGGSQWQHVLALAPWEVNPEKISVTENEGPSPPVLENRGQLQVSSRGGIPTKISWRRPGMPDILWHLETPLGKTL